jgi:hypothetical protein
MHIAIRSSLSKGRHVKRKFQWGRHMNFTTNVLNLGRSLFVLTAPNNVQFVNADGTREQLEPFGVWSDRFLWGCTGGGPDETSLALLTRADRRAGDERRDRRSGDERRLRRTAVKAFTSEVTQYFDREGTTRITEREVVAWIRDRAVEGGARRDTGDTAREVRAFGEALEPGGQGNWLDTYRTTHGPPDVH